MATYYVATTGNDGAAGSSGAPWATIVHGAAQLVAGDTLYVRPGTYVGSVSLAGLAGTEESPVALGVDPGDPGVVNLDGDSATALDLSGAAYVTVSGITVRNDGLWAGGANVTPAGVRIGGTSALATAQGAEHITLDGVEITGVNKTAHASSYSLPLAIYSNGDEDGGGTATHHVLITTCEIHDCDTYATAQGIYHPHVFIAGNVRDWGIVDCEIYDDTYDDVAAFDIAGGQLPTANPDQPRRGTIAGNTVAGFADNYGIYVNAVSGVLIAQNVVSDCKYGVGCQAEDPGYHDPPYTLEYVWVRENHVDGVLSTGISLGCFAANYEDTRDVWITQNTVAREISAPGSPAIWVAGYGANGVSGDAFVGGNLVAAPDALFVCTAVVHRGDFLDRNDWYSEDDAPFTWDGDAVAWPYSAHQDVNGSFCAVRPDFVCPGGLALIPGARTTGHRNVPGWYTAGMFGPYEPDMGFGRNWSGSPCK